MNVKQSSVILIAALVLVFLIGGCSNSSVEPTILTLWHNYGGQLKDIMDEMIGEFNETVGAGEGIIINVTSISGSAAIHEKLVMAANEEPGAPDLPDITTANPKTALILAEKGLLADLDELFEPDELSAYIPDFLEEGRLSADRLYLFPTAKSTEVLFVNTTLFERFAKETGARLEDLQTFEGIAKTASLYYDWTDWQTPEIEHDGKMFYMSDSLFNYALVGCRQLGADFIGSGGDLDFRSPCCRRIWESYFEPAVSGRFAIYNGYATDLVKTGEIVCSTGSTAGILFFSPTVTYADNTSEPAKMAILPYPVFEGGNRIALQRGAGMCVIKSEKKKERLAAVFLKWFTSPENNLRFVTSTGYLPVTTEAYGELMSRQMERIADERIKSLFITLAKMQRDYRFYVTPPVEGVDQLQNRYEGVFKEVALTARESYLELLNGSDPEEICRAVSAGSLQQIEAELR